MKTRTCSRILLSGGILIIIFVNLILFPQFPKWSGVQHPLKPLDLLFGFDWDTAHRLLSGMGTEGRRVYRISIWLIDMPYAVFYGFFYAWIFRCLTQNRFIVFLPFLITFFDISENLLFDRLLRQFPALHETTVRMASLFNQAKWTAALLTFFVFIYLLLRKIFQSKKT